ncbi:MAG TPA: response regulator [Rhizomicrobium sp.]|nr:response regulator [Rhizomicrobium sp.]
MSPAEKVNVLLVDDQPAKLLAYEAILQDLGENLIKASSAREAFRWLLKTDVAILLIDVCMPELDGFELAAMVRQHPRFQQTAIIFVSAIHITDLDRLRGYEMGAVDFVPVPVVPEVLRAKVRVFAELYRKTCQLEQLNADLERRVAERTAELEASNRSLRESERRRSLALAAGRMGSWDWDVATGKCVWDAGQYRIFGVDPAQSEISIENVRAIIDPDDMARIEAAVENGMSDAGTFQTEIRARRPDGQTRWCICAAAMTSDAADRVAHVSGVTIDITDLKEAEARRELLTREVDHRARNMLAIVQSIVHMTKAPSIGDFVRILEGRIRALSIAHALLAESRWEGANLDQVIREELAPYRVGEVERISISGPQVFLKPATAQAIAMVVHELATNAAKYGALSEGKGKVTVAWEWRRGVLRLYWQESGGPHVEPADTDGYGSKVIAASARQLGGTTRFDWQPTGLRFVMTMQVGDPSAGAEASPDLEDEDEFEPSALKSLLPAGGLILLVEDEAFVAMMMKDLIAEIGFHVVGPFGKITDAIENLDRHALVGAVLDVNLAGEKIYPLAEQLYGRGIPFVFVTGYAADAIDDRFASVPVLQKPVDGTALRRALNQADRQLC